MTGAAILLAVAAAAVSWHDLANAGTAATRAAAASSKGHSPVESVTVGADPGLGCLRVEVDLALASGASPDEVAAGLADGLGPAGTFRAAPGRAGGEIVLGRYRGPVTIGFSQSGDRAKVFACLCNDRYPAAAAEACPASPPSR